MSAARQSMETPLGKQYRTSLRPTNIGPILFVEAFRSDDRVKRDVGEAFGWGDGNIVYEGRKEGEVMQGKMSKRRPSPRRRKTVLPT